MLKPVYTVTVLFLQPFYKSEIQNKKSSKSVCWEMHVITLWYEYYSHLQRQIWRPSRLIIASEASWKMVGAELQLLGLLLKLLFSPLDYTVSLGQHYTHSTGVGAWESSKGISLFLFVFFFIQIAEQ